jgi:hypothetical protein
MALLVGDVSRDLIVVCPHFQFSRDTVRYHRRRTGEMKVRGENRVVMIPDVTERGAALWLVAQLGIFEIPHTSSCRPTEVTKIQTSNWFHGAVSSRGESLPLIGQKDLPDDMA